MTPVPDTRTYTYTWTPDTHHTCKHIQTHSPICTHPYTHWYIPIHTHADTRSLPSLTISLTYTHYSAPFTCLDNSRQARETREMFPVGNEGMAEDDLGGPVAIVLFVVVRVTPTEPLLAVVVHSFSHSACTCCVRIPAMCRVQF